MLIPRDICYTRQETSDEVHQREYSTLVRGSCPLNPQKKSASTAQTATNVSRIAHNRSMSSSNVTQALIGGCPFEWAQTQLSVRVRVAGRARFKWRRCLALTQGRPIPSARRNCGGVSVAHAASCNNLSSNCGPLERIPSEPVPVATIGSR